MRQPFLPSRASARSVVLALILTGALAGCAQRAAKVAATVDQSPAINTELIKQHMTTIADDKFEGRGPNGPGEQMMVDYATQYFKQLGLAGAFDGEFTQDVPMVQIRSKLTAPAVIAGAPGAAVKPEQGVDIVLGSRRTQPSIAVAEAPMVFVGYGVSAPEQNWDDYAGLDVKGKIVVMLINDPGFHVQDQSLFKGKAMTYYGRWTYKYEEAARRGAAGALIIHDTPGAAYGWEVVVNGWLQRPTFDLQTTAATEPLLATQGWLSDAFARQLLKRSGHDLDALVKAANQRGFKAIELKDKLTASISNSVVEGTSQNIAAIIPGRKHADEAIVYAAHWDHLGRNFAGADQIMNGAVDNASGTAAVLEIARRFAVGKQPERSVIFLLVTLEESGLLGSLYYAAHPPIAMDKTVAAINIDAPRLIGRTKDFVVVGFGQSELEQRIAPLVKAQNRDITPEPRPEDGSYFRSDHFSFAKAGVPALYARSGIDHIEKGKAFGEAEAARYVTEDYHKPSDEMRADFDFSGLKEDAEIWYGLGKELANDRSWPKFLPSSEFKRPDAK
jgi:Zn-dependent M28 family amino/carboxypeptidase